MRIVAVLGSPHGMEGTTGRLLAPALEAACAAGAEVRTFVLSETEVRPCRACDCCHRTGRCHEEDGFEAIRRAIEGAEGLVLASPNYIFSVTAQMKAFMDRCCGPMHLQAFGGKYGAAVVTSGGPEFEQVENYLLRFLRSLGMWTVGSVGAEGWKLSAGAAGAPVIKAAGGLGARLVDAIRRKATFPEQEAERRAFAGRMESLVMMRQDEWPFEYEQWKSRRRA